jgi:hypothetical protein
MSGKKVQGHPRNNGRCPAIHFLRPSHPFRYYPHSVLVARLVVSVVSQKVGCRRDRCCFPVPFETGIGSIVVVVVVVVIVFVILFVCISFVLFFASQKFALTSNQGSVSCIKIYVHYFSAFFSTIVVSSIKICFKKMKTYL